jgi:hypothetical protein
VTQSCAGQNGKYAPGNGNRGRQRRRDPRQRRAPRGRRRSPRQTTRASTSLLARFHQRVPGCSATPSSTLIPWGAGLDTGRHACCS